MNNPDTFTPITSPKMSAIGYKTDRKMSPNFPIGSKCDNIAMAIGMVLEGCKVGTQIPTSCSTATGPIPLKTPEKIGTAFYLHIEIDADPWAIPSGFILAVQAR